jgi:hypothetical protein
VTHPNRVVLASVRIAIADALEAGTPSQRKALVQELVSEIRVESRDSILPTYRLPAGPVRVVSGMVGRRGLEPPTSPGVVEGNALTCELLVPRLRLRQYPADGST